MPRIFACLAVAQLIVMILAGVLGLTRIDPDARRHVLMAVMALLLSCVNQIVAFTYLSVAGKMIAQAVHLGTHDVTPIHTLNGIKRSFTHMLAVVVVGLVFVTATGAEHWRTRESSAWHLAGAGLVIVAHALAYYRQYLLLFRAQQTLDGALAAYTALRGNDRSPPASPG